MAQITDQNGVGASGSAGSGELERAQRAYEAGREQRDNGNARAAQDNARAGAANSAGAGQAGGAR